MGLLFFYFVLVPHRILYRITAVPGKVGKAAQTGACFIVQKGEAKIFLRFFQKGRFL